MRTRSLLGALALILAAWGQGRGQDVVVRVAAFPNITHPQAMIGKANGRFEKALGPHAKIEWKSFNAGPSAIEALFAGAIDMSYVGPNPAINGYVRSNGEALRIIAGATSGAAALVVRNDAGVHTPQDFHGKRIASPQMGNTQDVALRAWLKSNGLKTRDKGGDVQVIPVANPDQLTLFLKKDLDAAWAPEPWASRLVREANGRILIDERTLWPNGQFITAHLIVSTKFLLAHPDVVKNWLCAHVELTDWINSHASQAKLILNQQILKETGKTLSAGVLERCFQPSASDLRSAAGLTAAIARAAFDAGFLGREMPDLSRLYDLTLLNQVLAEKGKTTIP